MGLTQWWHRVTGKKGAQDGAKGTTTAKGAKDATGMPEHLKGIAQPKGRPGRMPTPDPAYAVLGVEPFHAGDEAGDAGPARGDDPAPVDHLAVVEAGHLPVDGHERGPAPAQPGGDRLHDRVGERRRDRGVDGGPALGEHLDAGVRGQRVPGGDPVDPQPGVLVES